MHPVMYSVLYMISFNYSHEKGLQYKTIEVRVQRENDERNSQCPCRHIINICTCMCAEFIHTKHLC